MRHWTLQVAMWMLSRLLPEGDREPLIGDLAEEYSLRSTRVSSSAALKWCLQQVCGSVPILLWARLARAAWMATIGAALLAYAAVGVVELTVNWAISNSSSYNPLGMLITFPMVVLIGYFAARFRRSAAFVLGAMMLVAVTVMTLSATESMPMGYRIAYFLVGPLATLTGAGLHSLRSR